MCRLGWQQIRTPTVVLSGTTGVVLQLHSYAVFRVSVMLFQSLASGVQ